MQNRSAVVIFTILLVLACLFQLSFGWVAGNFEKEVKAEISDSLYDANAIHFDSLPEKVLEDSTSIYSGIELKKKEGEEIYPFLDYTYDECRERKINLGLDLKGGMNVTIEISLSGMVQNFASDNKNNTAFKNSFERAVSLQSQSTDDFITLFYNTFIEDNPDQQNQLWRIFSNAEYKDKFPVKATDKEILSILNDEAKEAINATENIVRQRIDRFGVTQPNIQKQGFSGRIIVELPGVTDKEKVRRDIQRAANLEFWELHSTTVVIPVLESINEALLDPETKILNDSIDAAYKEIQKAAIAMIDTTVATGTEADSLQQAAANQFATQKGDSLREVFNVDSLSGMLNPLLSKFQPNYNGQSSNNNAYVIGFSLLQDTTAVNSILFRNEKALELIPQKMRFYWSAKASENGVLSLYAIKEPPGRTFGKPRLDGGTITDASQDFDYDGSVIVRMQMNSEGAGIWKKMTEENVGKPVAIALDGYIYTAPNINEPIPNGSSQITIGGNGSSIDEDIDEAKSLAALLEVGALPAPSKIIEESVIGPTIGAENISKGLLSFAIAFVAILLYMIFYYNGAGLVANIALIANMFFLVGALASLQAVLTLPGIAGIVLTIGMSVDANVLIYERVREELRAGAQIRAAVTKGYEKAYSAIIDANLTTLFTAFVLAAFGSGPVKGFATTLIIGIFTSLFSAIFLTRLIFSYRLGKKKSVSFSNKMTENFLVNANCKFLARRKIFYVISSIVIVAGIASMVVNGFDRGVDFTGGTDIQISSVESFNGKTDEIRSELDKAFDDGTNTNFSTVVKTINDDYHLKVSTNYMLSGGDQTVLESKLIQGFENAGYSNILIDGSRQVDSVLSDDLRASSVKAIIFALIIIFIYIVFRFRRWQFGLGALVAMIHDVLIVLGLFSLLTNIMPFTLEIDQAFIAAILTVVGYSINDTVVVFDRIREYLGIHKRRSTNEVVNKALNSTLSRTINTSVSTFLVLFLIFIVGSESIKGFTFALMVGVIVGTYSSLCIATPLVVDFTKNLTQVVEKKKK